MLFTLCQRLVYIPFTPFYSYPPDSYCSCTSCSDMKTITLENITKAVNAMTSQITMKCKGKGVQCVLHLSATFSPQPFSLLHWAELLTLSLCLGFDLQLHTLERSRLPIDLQRLLSAHPCLAEKARGMMRGSAIWTFVLQCRQMHIGLWPKKGCAGSNLWMCGLWCVYVAEEWFYELKFRYCVLYLFATVT